MKEKEQRIAELARLLGRFNDNLARLSEITDDITSIARGLIGEMLVGEQCELPGMEQTETAEDNAPVEAVNIPPMDTVREHYAFETGSLVPLLVPSKMKKHSRKGLVQIDTMKRAIATRLPEVRNRDIRRACSAMHVELVEDEKGHNIYVAYRLADTIAAYLEEERRNEDGE